MTPVNRPDLDRVAAVIDRLRDTTKALEARHEVDRALAHFDKVISEDVEALRADKNLCVLQAFTAAPPAFRARRMVQRSARRKP